MHHSSRHNIFFLFNSLRDESKLEITPQRPFRVMLQFGELQVPVYIQENGKGAFFRASNLKPGMYTVRGASFRVELRDDKPETKKRKRRSKKQMTDPAGFGTVGGSGFAGLGNGALLEGSLGSTLGHNDPKRAKAIASGLGGLLGAIGMSFTFQ